MPLNEGGAKPVVLASWSFHITDKVVVEQRPIICRLSHFPLQWKKESRAQNHECHIVVDSSQML